MKGLLWKAILPLSILGIPIGVLTLYSIKPVFEQLCWIPIYFIAAWIVARMSDKKFFKSGIYLGIGYMFFFVTIHQMKVDSYYQHHIDLYQKINGLPSSNGRINLFIIDMFKAIIVILMSGVFNLVFCNGIRKIYNYS